MVRQRPIGPQFGVHIDVAARGFWLALKGCDAGGHARNLAQICAMASVRLKWRLLGISIWDAIPQKSLYCRARPFRFAYFHHKTGPMPTARKPPRSKLKAAEIVALYQQLALERPDPKTELDYVDPYTLVVAVALSAQATDVGVNKATKGLFAAANTPAKMVALGVEGVEKHIKTIGLWRNKAKNVVALSQMLLDDYGGVVPADRDALTLLPGVGRKTANVVLNEAFGEPTIAVDTHIFRVSNRTGLAPGKTPDHVEAILERVTPDAFKKGAHHWLILHGRYVCDARKPACWRCGIADICKFKTKTPNPADAPAKAKGKGAS
jgi:endonuclease III